MTGSSKSPQYNGARLAEENDVIVVSFKYAEIELRQAKANLQSVTVSISLVSPVFPS
jgi:adenosine deaminase